jgi:glycogen operon protein
MIRLRREHPIFRRQQFFQGRLVQPAGVKDIVWLTPDGAEMTDAQWREPHNRSLGAYLCGECLTEKDDQARPVTDASFLVLFNAHHEEIPFVLPQLLPESRWLMVMDTAYQDGLARGGALQAGNTYALQGRSLVLLQQQKVME